MPKIVKQHGVEHAKNNLCKSLTPPYFLAMGLSVYTKKWAFEDTPYIRSPGLPRKRERVFEASNNAAV